MMKTMMKNEKNILVTGAAGFIGRHVSRFLRNDGFQVFGVDWDEEAASRALTEDESVIQICSFDNYDVINKVRSGFYQSVVHLAATPRVPLSVTDPVGTHVNNVERTLLLLDACRERDVRLVFAGSSAAYGDIDVFPTIESSLKNPTSPYGLQKLIVDDYIKMFHMLYGSDMCSFRFFNVYGPGQYPGGSYPMAITAWTWSIANGSTPVLYGDGSIMRDYTYVGDVAEAVTMAVRSSQRLDGCSYNVCSGTSLSMLDVWKHIKSASKFNGDIVFAPPRAGDARKTHGSFSNTSARFGWAPSTPFKNGVEKTWEWVSRESSKLSLQSIQA